MFLYGASNLFRVIPTDGRPHRADADPSYMGDSIGRFEGDTLVVDVTNFNDDTWLGSDGYFHTEKMHVVERLTRKGDVLTYSATVEDPDVLAKPWTTTPRRLKLSTSQPTRCSKRRPASSTTRRTSSRSIITKCWRPGAGRALRSPAPSP